MSTGEPPRPCSPAATGRFPPREGWLNKADGRKKRIFRYGPLDELLFRTVHRLLQPTALQLASPWCRSFLPGGGARAAFAAVVADRDVGSKAALRLDVRDYFNSIDVDHLLTVLPPPLSTGVTGALLSAALRDRRVWRDGALADGWPKGVMAGTPLAPLLATLYLTDFDDEAAATGVTYARYSDDILVLAPPDELAAVECLLRIRLAERGLKVNETKTATAAPGDPWDFLGFRFADGNIRLAPLTIAKVRSRTSRVARRVLRWRERRGVERDHALWSMTRRLNRRLYGAAAGRSEFSWATWFLPMLDSPDDLPAIDAHVQRELRYAATGRRTARARAQVPYPQLAAAGYLPLVAAYWAGRTGLATYDALVAARTGLPVVSRSQTA